MIYQWSRPHHMIFFRNTLWLSTQSTNQFSQEDCSLSHSVFQLSPQLWRQGRPVSLNRPNTSLHQMSPLHPPLVSSLWGGRLISKAHNSQDCFRGVLLSSGVKVYSSVHETFYFICVSNDWMQQQSLTAASKLFVIKFIFGNCERQETWTEGGGGGSNKVWYKSMVSVRDCWSTRMSNK